LPEQVKRAAAMAGTPKREKQGELKFAPTRGRKAADEDAGAAG